MDLACVVWTENTHTATREDLKIGVPSRVWTRQQSDPLTGDGPFTFPTFFSSPINVLHV